MYLWILLSAIGLSLCACGMLYFDIILEENEMLSKKLKDRDTEIMKIIHDLKNPL